MTQWQFLIQKEGDQEWLPLESSNVEILEGRYRLVVQVDPAISGVQVQIRHEYDEDGVMQEVIQRLRQPTDDQGCLELFPLSYMSPGQWELRCQCLVDHQLAQPLQERKICLQVLSQDFESLEDWGLFEPPGPGFAIAPSANTEGVALHPELVTVELVTGSSASEPSVQEQPPSLPLPELPYIPKDIPQVSLQICAEFRLPPMIYDPATLPDEFSSPVMLPSFLPSQDAINAAEAAKAEQAYLEFLRRVAKSTDRQAVQLAFESLAWRERFWQTLHSLAQLSGQPESVDCEFMDRESCVDESLAR